MKAIAWLLALGASLPARAAQEKELVLNSPVPVYKAVLPKGYAETAPREDPLRYIRASGREDWAKVSAILRTAPTPIPQNPAGITEAEILPFLTLPPDAKRNFLTVRWMNLDLGVVEYRAVVKELPVVGRSAVLPLRGRAVVLTVYAPDPLEKDMKDDFAAILSSFTAVPSWRTEDVLATIRTYDRTGAAGAGLLALYLPALGILFRGHPMRAHWLRTLWLVLSAVLLFVPIFSPGDTTFLNNLLVNAMLPMVILLFAGRRIKLGLEML